jgi:hypothetical protein
VLCQGCLVEPKWPRYGPGTVQKWSIKDEKQTALLSLSLSLSLLIYIYIPISSRAFLSCNSELLRYKIVRTFTRKLRFHTSSSSDSDLNSNADSDNTFEFCYSDSDNGLLNSDLEANDSELDDVDSYDELESS